MAKSIKVMIVEDSAVVRQTLSDIFESDQDIEVIATASDPYVAVQRLKTHIPDVITLDVEMPKMDGITFLKKIMSQHPIPVVMLSSLTQKGSKIALQALEYGAVSVLEKPKVGAKKFLEDTRVELCDTVKAAAKANVKKLVGGLNKIPPKLSADVVIEKSSVKESIQTTEKIVAIGASTGGTEALRYFLTSLPANSPGIVIVQHMPAVFTKSFAERLNELSDITVKEAEDGDTILKGHALIAPGNKHMLVKRSGTRYFVEIKEGPLVNRHRPSVDVLFRSTARYCGANAIGVILTGMGDDGAKGLLEMKESGAYTFAQDEKSCVVYGMPREAVEMGAANEIKSLNDMSVSVLKQYSKML